MSEYRRKWPGLKLEAYPVQSSMTGAPLMVQSPDMCFPLMKQRQLQSVSTPKQTSRKTMLRRLPIMFWA